MKQKVMIVSEKELADLKTDIVIEIRNFSKKPYGFKMVSRETGEEIVDITEILGMLFHPIEKTIDAMGTE